MSATAATSPSKDNKEKRMGLFPPGGGKIDLDALAKSTEKSLRIAPSPVKPTPPQPPPTASATTNDNNEESAASDTTATAAPQAPTNASSNNASNALLENNKVSKLLASRKSKTLPNHSDMMDPVQAAILAGSKHNANSSSSSNGDGSITSPSAELTPEEVKAKMELRRRMSKRLSFCDHRQALPVSDFSLFPPKIRAQYKIVQKIGAGAFADVYKAEDRETKEVVAIKVVYKKRVESKERLNLEIEALEKAKHPNIICLKETVVADDHIYLIQELAQGGCLFDVLVDANGLDEHSIAIATMGLLEALTYLHKIGIVHRDIKLENILLGETNNLHTIKISDFGVAHILQDKEYDEVGYFRPILTSRVGSVTYMAPEIFLDVPYNNAVDLWALGVLVYMMLSLCDPFGNDENEPSLQLQQIRRIIKADYSFNAKVWDRYGDDVKDFVSGLLKLDSSERLTALGALQHPWILKHREIMKKK